MREAVVVRETTLQDAEAVAALQATCFPPPFPAEALFTAKHVRQHVERFATGQFVATAGGVVVASATNMLMQQADWEAHRPWDKSVGGLDLPRHDPEGSVLFGVDISVAPDWRRCGLGRRLYKERFRLVRHLGLVLYGTVCRTPGYSESGLATPNAYVESVCRGASTDRTLTPLLRMGLDCKGVIDNYMEDCESGDAGVVLEWRP
ncbi:MAG: GNAT family N-acetyltransferase [Armatimonadetes bacterium]|nr:GNAT family N-acetyltransferase [Armatimonadota bacterium]